MKSRKFTNHKLKRSNDALGFTVNCILLSLGILPIFGSLVCVSLSIDPFYYVAEEILTHPYDRSLLEILGSYAVRLAVLILSAQEYLRWVALVSYAILVSGFGVISVLCKLQKIRDSRKSVPLYSRLFITFVAAEEGLGIVSCLGIFLLHFGTVLTLWVSIRCWDLVPMSILFICCLLGVSLLLFSALIFPTMAKVGLETEQLIRQGQNKNYVTSRTARSSRLYYYTVWRASQAIDVPCANFFTFGQEVTRGYLDWVITNLVNMSLLLNPEAL